MSDVIIPQVILVAPEKIVKLLQKKYPCTETGGAETGGDSTFVSSTECLKECKAVWVPYTELIKDLDTPFPDDILFVLSQLYHLNLKIGRVCFTYGDVHTLNDCASCVHFHDAIVKEG